MPRMKSLLELLVDHVQSQHTELYDGALVRVGRVRSIDTLIAAMTLLVGYVPDASFAAGGFRAQDAPEGAIFADRVRARARMVENYSGEWVEDFKGFLETGQSRYTRDVETRARERKEAMERIERERIEHEKAVAARRDAEELAAIEREAELQALARQENGASW